MTPMNEFIVNNMGNLREFVDHISGFAASAGQARIR